MTSTDTPDFTAHLCLRARACRANDPPAVTEAPGTLCPQCVRFLKNVVHQLPSDWLELHASIGDHAPTSDRDRRVRIRSTPTAPVPINTTRDALAAAIVECAEHAAAIISDTLRHHPQPKDWFVGSRMPPGRRRDSPRYRCNEYGWLQRDTRLIEANLELLVEHRDPELTWTMQWSNDGTDIGLSQVTGLAVIDAITIIHDKVRGELGKRVLRHRCSMPCPRCGGELGRLDGTMVVDCPEARGGCGSSWTEREYKWMVGLHVEDEMDKIMKAQLDEANSRLDSIQRLVDTLASMTEAEITACGAGPLILDELSKRIEGHSRPDQRTAKEARADVQERQDAEERWAWEGERPYRPPKRKKVKRDAGPPEHPVLPVSRSVITEDPTYTGVERVDREKLCRCNTVHAGEC